MKSVFEPSAMEIIEQKLIDSGMSREDAIYLICRFLEEEAKLYVECKILVKE